MTVGRTCVRLVGAPSVGASLVGALNMMTNAGSHEGLPLHASDRLIWDRFRGAGEGISEAVVMGRGMRHRRFPSRQSDRPTYGASNWMGAPTSKDIGTKAMCPRHRTHLRRWCQTARATSDASARLVNHRVIGWAGLDRTIQPAGINYYSSGWFRWNLGGS